MPERNNIDTEFDRLVESVYAGTIESTPWESFLNLFRQAMDAKVISLVLRPPAADDAGLILNHRRALPDEDKDCSQGLANTDEWPVTAYKEHFYSLDPFVNLPLGAVVTLDELLPLSELTQSVFYQQYLEPAGVFHIVGADTREPNGLVARLRAMRGQDESPFSEKEIRLFSRLMPHLRCAIQIHVRLNTVESERDIYAGAVNQLAVGTIILDEQGRVIKTNDRAQSLLTSADGIGIKDRRLFLADREASREFQGLIDQILLNIESPTPHLTQARRIRRPSGKADLAAVLRPVPRSEWTEGQGHPSLAIFLSDPEQQTSTSRETLVSLFGFTPAESTLAVELARGLSLAEASQALGISPHTARAQLKSIFAKAGVTRQAELIRLMLKSVATLA
ncbi:MAG: helix-turn-helix transcriptional regulator [Pseudomonadales bacterium]